MVKIDDAILKVVVLFLAPIVLLLAFYVQVHGDYSPGGGFQAGAIAASIFIAYSVVTGRSIQIFYIRVVAVIGVFVYAGTGCVAMIMGGNFLNYSVLLTDSVSAQGLGVMLVEAGVGMTVLASMLLIYNSLNLK